MASTATRSRWLNQRVADLNAFRFSTQAKTPAAKTMELHEVWRDVYCDLENVGCEADLDPSSVVQVFHRQVSSRTKEGMGRFLQDCQRTRLTPRANY